LLYKFSGFPFLLFIFNLSLYYGFLKYLGPNVLKSFSRAYSSINGDEEWRCREVFPDFFLRDTGINVNEGSIETEEYHTKEQTQGIK
jgi:hypothetical protein